MSQPRRNTFDFLRLLAALAVVVQHATVHLDARFLWVTPGNPWWLYDGVTAFFIISGYFVFRSAERLHAAADGWTDFYVNRALRIVPAIWTYVAAAAVLVLLIGAATFADLLTLPGVGWVLSGLLLVPVYSPDFLDDFGIGTVNGSLWTIPVEVSFYIVVPIFVLIAHRVGPRIFVGVLLPAAAIGVLLAVPLDGSLATLYGFTFVPYLWAFGLGVTWYLAADRIRLTWIGFIAGVGAYVLARVISHLGEDSRWVPTAMDLLGTAGLSYVVIFIGFRGPRWFRAVTDRVGDLSFGTYIWHMIVVNLFIYWGVEESLPSPLIVPAVVVVTLGLAVLSWRLVERPALARKRHSTRADLASDAAQTRI